MDSLRRGRGLAEGSIVVVVDAVVLEMAVEEESKVVSIAVGSLQGTRTALGIEMGGCRRDMSCPWWC